jgi:hypothetical protein
MSAFSAAAAAATANNEGLTGEELHALQTPENPDQLPPAPVTYRNYQPGQYIKFTRYNHLPWVYGIIAGPSSDIQSGGKRYPFIYCDDTQINTNSSLTDTARREAQEPRTVITSLDEKIINNELFYFLKYPPDDTPRMIYYTREVRQDEIEVSQDDIEGIGNILNILSTAFLRGSGAFDTPPVSRSTTGNSNISRSSSNYSPAVSRSTTGSSVGGKKYRKRKNKTRRRNKKTKRRTNRKTKRR